MPDPLTSGTLVRIQHLESEVERLTKQLDELSDKVTEDRIATARLSERLAIYQLLQSAYATVVGAVAAVLGRTI